MFAQVPFRQLGSSAALPTAGFHPLFNKPAARAVVSKNFADLSRIYEDGVNLCLIERRFPIAIEQFVYQALQNVRRVEIRQTVAPLRFDFEQLWPQASHLSGYQVWMEDVSLLVSAFSELFDCREVGMRLYTLDKAMCPRFHVDRVPARLICSYGGIGTEWLPEYALERAKLGVGGCGLPDTDSGLITDITAIRQMPAYAVGLMKGESWEGNEGQGLVHRSPQPTAVQPRRLLLTLDML
ncbi:MAG: DUF1826 domain-containing protein [Methylomonas lenta]|nr:DUF1826 domain-containing protein [Methylomonas lenta]